MSKKSILFFAVVCVIIFSLAVISMTYAGAPTGSNGAYTVSDLSYEPGELLVRFAPKADGTQRTLVERNDILAAINGGSVHHSYKLVPGLTLVKLPEDVTVANSLVLFKNTGGICWDSDYIYICVATNTWKRAALSSW